MAWWVLLFTCLLEGVALPSFTQCGKSGTAAPRGGAAGSASKRLSVEELVCVLQCSSSEPALERFLAPHLEEPSLLSLERLDAFCDPRADFTLTVAVAVWNQSIYWRKCHSDEDDGGCMQALSDQDTHRWLRLLYELLEVVEVANALFLVQCGDEPNMPIEHEERFPVFHPEGGHGFWNIPWLNPYQLKALQTGFLDNRTRPSSVQWDQKLPKAYWRGQLCGPNEVPLRKASALPRFRIFELAKQRPELFDVAVVGIDEELTTMWGKKAVKRLIRKHQVRFVEPEDLEVFAPKYRYLLNLNGVVSSWRLSHLLGMGSVLLLQRSQTHEALQELLEPWTHYVPLADDLSDLLGHLELLRNETLAASLAKAAQELFARRVRPEDTYCFALRSLEVSRAEVTLEALLQRGFEAAPSLKHLDEAWHPDGLRPLRQRLQSRAPSRDSSASASAGRGVASTRAVLLHRQSCTDVVGVVFSAMANLVELIDAFHDEGSKMVSIVLEFCIGGDMLEVMSRHRGKNSKGLRESATCRAMTHMFRALAYLHEQGVVHRDVKCENVFKLEAPNQMTLEDCTYKLGDLGLAACVMPDEVLMEQVGSPSTSAPEVVRGRPYGKPADLWSAGAAIYTLLAGRRPFEASSYHQMVKVMSKVEVTYTGDTWLRTSKAAMELLLELLQENPDKRPTAAKVLKHAWCQRDHRVCTTS
ncbi:unnamed protein product [Durusdinium trenchii]|uniref:Protein kinase domain-containing protein n=1 Tax=Durusdinium trenchii TaxID=1381693 RepID=A0ABP0NWF6_9DINO